MGARPHRSAPAPVTPARCDLTESTAMRPCSLNRKPSRLPLVNLFMQPLGLASNPADECTQGSFQNGSTAFRLQGGISRLLSHGRRPDPTCASTSRRLIPRFKGSSKFTLPAQRGPGGACGRRQTGAYRLMISRPATGPCPIRPCIWPCGLSRPGFWPTARNS